MFVKSCTFFFIVANSHETHALGSNSDFRIVDELHEDLPKGLFSELCIRS